MSVNEYFYKGVNIILQVSGEREYKFTGFVFFDNGNGVTTERVTGGNTMFASREEAFKYGSQYISWVVDNNLLLN